TNTTSSLWEHGAQGRRRRCCSRVRAIEYSSSTVPHSRAIRSRRTWFIHLGSPPWRSGGCWSASPQQDVLQLVPIRSTSARSRFPGRRVRRTALSHTAHGEPSSTRFSSTLRRKPVRRFGKGSRLKRL